MTDRNNYEKSHMFKNIILAVILNVTTKGFPLYGDLLEKKTYKDFKKELKRTFFIIQRIFKMLLAVPRLISAF